MKRFFSMLLALVMVVGLMPVFSLTAPAAEVEAAVKIGEYGLDTYGASALDIVRDTAVNTDGTVSVTFRLKDDLNAVLYETWIVLRFRYDTDRMELTEFTRGDVFSEGEVVKSGTLGYIPYGVLVECSKDYYPAGNICTLTFSVKDTDSTDVFGESKPYWWVDLGGEDTGSNPVTAFLPDFFSEYCAVTLYEGTRTGIPDEQPADIVWVGGQGMYASADGTVVSYYTNGAEGAAGTVSATEPDQWHAKLYYDDAAAAYTLDIKGLNATGIANDEDSLGAGIYSTVPLTIDMTGENHVTGDVYNYRAHGVYVTGALTFQGTGSLEVKAKDSLSDAYSRSIGVYTTGLLSVNGGTLTAAAGQAKGISSGVFVYQFTITGGTFEAWCTTSPDSTSTENYAVKMFDVVGNNFAFSDEKQTNDQWYEWTLQADENGDPINKVRSTDKEYVHDEDENWKSLYLYIAPMGDIQYTVTLDSNGGTPTYEIKVSSGESANEAFNRQADTEGKDAGEELVPTRDGYTFGGWYTDKDTWKNKYDFNSEVTADITVYAKWEEAAPPVVVPPVVISGTASLTKVDAEDPATVLPGVVFELYRLDGALMGAYTTNASGQITVYGLLPGTYYWREIRAAEGYVLDETEHVFTVYAGQTSSLVVENERSKVPEAFSSDHYAYIIGYDDGMVHPEANITRAEVATIFFRLLDEETRNQYMTRENSFVDVSEEAWYNTAVSTMAAMGIVTGRPGNIFDPNANITRAEFAAIAARFDANGNTTGASFTDIYDHWAMKEINIAANNGWVLGYEDGTFRPDQNITRAEAMTMVNRVLQRIPESVDDLHPGMILWPDNMDATKWYYLMVQEATNSHDYIRKNNGYENWSGLRETPDWAALERVIDSGQ